MLRKWRTKVAVASILMVFLCAVPAALCSVLSRPFEYFGGIVLFDILGCMVVRFLTNNYQFGILLYLGISAIEVLLLLVSHSPLLALWIGDLIPALVAIHYLRQLYINMGD